MGNDECCNVAVETQLIASLRWGGKMLKPNTQNPKIRNQSIKIISIMTEKTRKGAERCEPASQPGGQAIEQDEAEKKT